MARPQLFSGETRGAGGGIELRRGPRHDPGKAFAAAGQLGNIGVRGFGWLGGRERRYEGAARVGQQIHEFDFGEFARDLNRRQRRIIHADPMVMANLHRHEMAQHRPDDIPMRDEQDAPPLIRRHRAHHRRNARAPEPQR